MKPLSQKARDRAFVLMAATTVIAVVGFGAWLDRDLIGRDIDEAIGAAQIEDGLVADQVHRAEQDTHALQVRDAYQQGLREGAAGSLAAMSRQQSLQVAQACRAIASITTAGTAGTAQGNAQ